MLHLIHLAFMQRCLLDTRQHMLAQLRSLIEERQHLKAMALHLLKPGIQDPEAAAKQKVVNNIASKTGKNSEMKLDEDQGLRAVTDMRLDVALGKLRHNIVAERKLFLQLHEIIVKQVSHLHSIIHELCDIALYRPCTHTFVCWLARPQIAL